MGLIDMAQKAQRAKFNQRVAATRKLEVARTPDQIPHELESLFVTWNAEADVRFHESYEKLGRFMRSITNDVPSNRHYGFNDRFLNSQPPTLMVVYGFRPQCLDEGGKGFSTADHGWISLLGIAPSDKGSVLTLQLQKWTVNQQGLLWNGDKYVALLDGLVTSLDGRYLTDPINDEDRRFVRRAV